MRIHPKVTEADRAALRDRVLDFMEGFGSPKIVITIGLNGLPRYRLMSARTVGFRCYLISVKPSVKRDELLANPNISILWYDDAATDLDQPLRLVAIDGTATIVESVAGLRAFPSRSARFSHAESRWKIEGVNPPENEVLDDSTLDASRFGIIVEPRSVRVEGFLPGPRYPIYLASSENRDPSAEKTSG